MHIRHFDNSWTYCGRRLGEHLGWSLYRNGKQLIRVVDREQANDTTCLPCKRSFEEQHPEGRVRKAAAELGRRGGKKRAENLNSARRREIACAAATKRWKK